MEYVYISKEGLENLKKELHKLKYKIRPAVSQKVASAREQGDLKENAEYHAAREELSLTETKVQQLQDRIARARIVEEDEIGRDEISILNKVRLLDLKREKEIVYTLVSEDEADIKQKKISIASPVAKGLLGRKKGEIAEIQVPAGLLRYKILAIE